VTVAYFIMCIHRLAIIEKFIPRSKFAAGAGPKVEAEGQGGGGVLGEGAASHLPTS